MRDLRPLIRQEVRDTVFLARYGRLPRRHSDSALALRYTREERMLARMIADERIRSYSKRHNDFISVLALKGAVTLLLPILKILAKGAVGSAISGGIKEKIVNPILTRLIGHGKQIIENRGDDSYLVALGKGFKSDMQQLIDVLKNEKSAIVSRIVNVFNKIRGI